jgi:hypothetical protein
MAKSEDCLHFHVVCIENLQYYGIFEATNRKSVSGAKCEISLRFHLEALNLCRNIYELKGEYDCLR